MVFWQMNYAGGPGEPKSVASPYSMLTAIIVAAFAAVIIGKIIVNSIDLRFLISEDNGNASLSRFQFLLFTFVIASSYFLLVLKTTDLTKLPDIPPTVLGLIGVSGGSYVIAKGIQKNADANAASSVSGVTVGSGGTGYSAQTSVQFGNDGGGSGAVGTVQLGPGGSVASVNMQAGGSGYLRPPSVTFIDPTGTGKGATAVSVIG
jgi:hypothetical protein